MSLSRIIKIASRTSPLALWQTNTIKARLEKNGHRSEIVFIESTGDLQLAKPIYELGVTGVFTKELDAALLDKRADIAVHSLKDVPTQMAEGLFLAAVAERGAWEDVAIVKNREMIDNNQSVATIATSSLRRRAQWLAKYPKHRMVPIRGNVQTRLRKFEEAKEVDAVIFAKAGLERLNALPSDAVVLDWMLPAPAQGIIGVVCREDDEDMKEICGAVNDRETFIRGSVERQFMKTLMGGCSVPISALAEINRSELDFRGAVHSYDGKIHFAIHRVMLVLEWADAGKASAEKLLQQPGAAGLVEEIRNKKWDEKSVVD